MIRKTLPFLILCTFILTGCMFFQDRPAKVIGSGNIKSEPREVSGFTSISLEGSGNVDVSFGDSEALVIEAEDNIIPLIETRVRNNTLVISTTPGNSYEANDLVHFRVTMKSLSSVSIGGSGNIQVPDLNGDSFTVGLPGSGNIIVSGQANNVNITLGGSGNIYCDQLKTKSATTVLKGSGNITVFASDSLDAVLSGSGSIRYSGHPGKITQNITGSGTIQE